MKLLGNLCAAAAALLVVGCGGGGTRIVSTPPAPPAPPAVTYASFGSLTSDQLVPLTGVALSRTDTTTATTSTTGATTIDARPFSGDSLSISYNASTNGYTVRDGANSQPFVPADIRSDFTFNGPAFVNYARGVGTATEDYLSIYRPAGGGGDVALTYTTLAQWIRIAHSSTGTTSTAQTDAVWAVGGFATLASDMPRTGTASYSGPLRGIYVQGTTLANVSGLAQLAADFGAGTVRADLTLNRSGFSTLLVGGNGTISSARFAGNLAGSGFTGTFDGGFFGPQAAEMGFSFIMSDATGQRIAGVGGGRR